MIKKILQTAKTFLSGILQAVLATLLLFLILESVSFLLGFPPGASKYIETLVLKAHLGTKKPAGEFRIFTYGESTMHGSHYGPVSNPARWLEAYLKDFLPERNVRVVNFSRMGAGPSFVQETFQDTLAYKPDLAIFYLGHNVFLHENRYDEVRMEKSKPSYRVKKMTRASRFISAVYRQFLRFQMKSKHKIPEDQIEFAVVETAPIGHEYKLASWGSPYYWENISHFKQMLVDILDLAKKNRVPVLFLRPVSNLKDFRPSYSLNRSDLSKKELAEWRVFYIAGKKSLDDGELNLALEYFKRANAIDPDYADLAFQTGRVLLKKGQTDRARRYFEHARDRDAYISRATSEVIKVFKELEAAEGLQLLDTEKMVVSEIPEGILGEPLIEDNVHFSIRGHAMIGRKLADELAARGFIAPKEKWRFSRERSFIGISKGLQIDRDLIFSADLKMVHYFGSRFENRIRFAKKALEIYPDDARALRHLAWTHWLAGEYGKALAVYRRLKKVHPEALQTVFQYQPSIKEELKGFAGITNK